MSELPNRLYWHDSDHAANGPGGAKWTGFVLSETLDGFGEHPVWRWFVEREGETRCEGVAGTELAAKSQAQSAFEAAFQLAHDRAQS